uniref:Transposase n=1 Tax=Globodera rostochiensis TaxID=31243 RepID=A0A914H9M3_GLORO
MAIYKWKRELGQTELGDADPLGDQNEIKEKMKMEQELKNTKEFEKRVAKLELENKALRAEMEHQKLLNAHKDLTAEMNQLNVNIIDALTEAQKGNALTPQNGWDPAARHEDLTLSEPKRLIAQFIGKNRGDRSVFAKCQFRKRISAFFLATCQTIYSINGKRLDTANLFVSFAAELFHAFRCQTLATKL